MILKELFDHKSPVEIVSKSSSNFEASAVIGGRTILFSANKDEEEDPWEIEFAETDNENGKLINHKHKMTNRGSEFKVMAFIVAMLNRFVEEVKPQKFGFSAGIDEPSRVTSYRKMVNRFAADAGYQVEESVTRLTVRFMFTKKRAIKEDKEFKNDENGSLVYGWKSVSELNDEEGSRYIPVRYTKVLELGGIYANEPGKGQGDVLMKQFLASKEAQEAELIFLDPVPGVGKNFKNGSEIDQVRSLIRFYTRYGFKHNPKSNRMWLVKKGKIADDRLPT